jgi:hypothetical protein
MLQKLCDNPDSGCTKTRGVEIGNKRTSPWFNTLIPKFRQYVNENGKHVTEYETVCIDVPVYLAILTSMFVKMGGKFKVKTVKHMDIRKERHHCHKLLWSRRSLPRWSHGRISLPNTRYSFHSNYSQAKPYSFTHHISNTQ